MYRLVRGYPNIVPKNVRRARVDPGVRVIGERAFYDCRKLATLELHEGLEEVRDRAFRNCELLREVMVPRSVRMIDDSAFRDCVSLVEVGLWGRLCDEHLLRNRRRS